MLTSVVLLSANGLRKLDKILQTSQAGPAVAERRLVDSDYIREREREREGEREREREREREWYVLVQ